MVLSANGVVCNAWTEVGLSLLIVVAAASVLLICVASVVEEDVGAVDLKVVVDVEIVGEG